MTDINQQVNKLHVFITTGDDDVRGGSNVYGVAIIRQGLQINTFTKSLNDGANWQNGTSHDAYLEIPQVQIKDIQGFRIVFSSGSCPFCTQDNWNMNAIKVLYVLNSGQDNQNDPLINKGDDPVHRFTGSSSEWDYSFHWD